MKYNLKIVNIRSLEQILAKTSKFVENFLAQYYDYYENKMGRVAATDIPYISFLPTNLVNTYLYVVDDIPTVFVT